MLREGKERWKEKEKLKLLICREIQSLNKKVKNCCENLYYSEYPIEIKAYLQE